MRPKALLSLLLSGLGIGWLMGLSVSPVVGLVMTSLLTVLTGISGGIVGLEPSRTGEDERHRQFHRLDPMPLAIVVIGVVFGSALGITARAHAWLEPTVDQVASKWRGIDRREVIQRLFDQAYPLSAPPASGKPNVTATVLYEANDEECSRFRVKEGEELRADLQTSISSISARNFANEVKDPVALKAAVNFFICPK